MKDSLPSTFEFLLLGAPSGAFDAGAALDALHAGGRVQPLGSDLTHVIYRNPDTGVVFPLTLAARIADHWRARLDGAGEDGYIGAPLDQDQGNDGDDDDDEDEGEDDEDDEDEAFEIEETPVVVNVPLLCPAFFALEAVDLALRVTAAAGLHLERPEPKEGVAPPGGADHHAEITADGLLTEWDRARHALVGALFAQGDGKISFTAGSGCSKVHGPSMDLTFWSPAKSDAWFLFGSARAALRRELEAEGIHVPILQAAAHQGQVKTLCDWRAGSPVALPRTDLVLLRRERSKKGLIFTRRVMEEGIVDGQVIWDLLAPHGEVRKEPSEMVIFRHPGSPPQDVTARLKILATEPLESARRAALVGVLDFDPGTLEQPPGGARG